jgi:hypothetical protein
MAPGWARSDPTRDLASPDGTASGCLLTGTIRRAGRHVEPEYLDLVGDDTRRWNETHAFFGDRESPASASLRKVL